jgi:hypothetical protein
MSERKVSSVRIAGDFALVELTQGLWAKIDAADVPIISGRKWQAVITKRSKYAATFDGAAETSRVYMHRLLMSAQPGQEVDHKNRDGLDNRRSENLRLASRSENASNVGLSKANTRGVRFYPSKNKWRAVIGHKGKIVHVGYFDDPTAAKEAYQAASVALHGQFGGAA